MRPVESARLVELETPSKRRELKSQSTPIRRRIQSYQGFSSSLIVQLHKELT